MAERTERAVVNHLIEICRDGELGFRTAAEHVKDPSLKTLFDELAAARARFASELVPHFHRLGGQEGTGGTTTGALHRRWMAVKDVMSGHRDAVVLTEAERGEQAAMSAYEEALEEILDPPLHEVIERQYTEVREASERVRAREAA